MKQELEEAAEKLTKDFPGYSVRDNMDNFEIKGWFLEALQKGAKWQADRMYSEEEVLYVLIEFYKTFDAIKNPPQTNTIPLWYEQFKNK